MQRVTISIDDELDDAYNQLIEAQGYQSKSEAIRDLVRQAVEARRVDGNADGLCVASLSYVYDHNVRTLAQRLVELQHDHHEVVVASMHVHLDHDDCLETSILKGSTASVRRLADLIQAERGVRFARINLISVSRDEAHDHGQGRPHSHLSPAKG